MTVVVDTIVVVSAAFWPRSVTKDKDLLALEKPFGVEVVTPREFYRRLES